MFYYSVELNRNIEIDYSDFDKFYLIKNEELYINSKYFNLVSFGFTNQLIETETHYKYINNFYDNIEESEKELIEFKKLNNNTLLIDINSWKLKDLEVLLEDKNLQDSKNIIMDLRNNGGGYAANVIELLQFIINKRISAYTIKEGEIANKKFSYIDNEGFYITKEYIHPINNSDKKNIITLINENSYSSSNTFATLVKENNIGLLIGEKSGGGAYTPRYFYQENGNLLGVPSSFGLFSKEGYDYENGVEPDIYVKDEIIDGKDMILERALKELKNQ